MASEELRHQEIAHSSSAERELNVDELDGLELLAQEAPNDLHVIAANGQDDFFGVEGLVQDGRKSGLHGAERQIDLAGGEAIGRDEKVHRHDAERRVGQIALEAGKQRGKMRNRLRVAPRERETAGAFFRDERGSVDGGLELAHGALHEGGELLCARRRDEPAPVTHEERILKELAQAGERVRDGGLRHVELLRSLGDAPFREHGVEHQEQIQIEARE
jgi:hypothetical protein